MPTQYPPQHLYVMNYFLTCAFVVALTVNASAEEVLIDTLYDLEHAAGWTATCTNGYERNVEDFRCGLLGIRVNIPPEHLEGEIGFWTGCGKECDLTYTVAPNDLGFRFRAYFHGMHMIVTKNGIIQEEVAGANWTVTEVDLSFTNTIELRLKQIVRNGFVALERIIVEKEDPTTTTTPSTTTELCTSGSGRPSTEPTWSPSSEPTRPPSTNGTSLLAILVPIHR